MATLKSTLRDTIDFVVERFFDLDRVDKGTQTLLMLKYRELLEKGGKLPDFSDIGFRSFSQNDEDGILLFVFSLIGTTNRGVVEACAGDGIQCNAANLIINHGWHGLLLDGNKEAILRGRRFHSRCRDTRSAPPALEHAWLEPDNVNEIISRCGYRGEIDLLSLDMDGMDYWVWNAIDCIQPRVVVAESQIFWGPEDSVTVPYQRGFARDSDRPSYYGASPAALVKLARTKGYRLVGCNRYGFNIFFVRAGVGEQCLPEVPVHTCYRYRSPRSDLVRRSRHEAVKDLEWTRI